MWLVDTTWPIWVLGLLVVDSIQPGPAGVGIIGGENQSRWFPHARVGIAGAFTYKRTLAFPAEKRPRPRAAIRLSAEQEVSWVELLGGAPTDNPSCYCGQCQKFKEPATFSKGGHQVCKACRSRIHYERYDNARRRVLRESTDRPLTDKDWMDCKAFFADACAYCGGRRDLTRDHVISVWREGGQHTRHNVVPACRSCNSKKSNYDMEDWYRQMPSFTHERLSRIGAWMSGHSGEN